MGPTLAAAWIKFMYEHESLTNVAQLRMWSQLNCGDIAGLVTAILADVRVGDRQELDIHFTPLDVPRLTDSKEAV